VYAKEIKHDAEDSIREAKAAMQRMIDKEVA